jgi:muramoyltetrapeptide carboxypeptidase LdcA involved in peptidoglycan recycling
MLVLMQIIMILTMKPITPKKLGFGDKIRVVAPAMSLSMIAENNIGYAINKLNEIGLNVDFSKHAKESDMFESSRIKSRVNDLHDAFEDDTVRAILSVIGGFNSNQLLGQIDYELIKYNPKIFCGFSDITALSNAIFAKTGLITYSGPHFSTFGMQKGIDYTVEYFNKCLYSETPFEILPSKKWSDDAWYLNQEERLFIPNDGPKIIQEGEAEGTSIGGNLCTFQLLHGTEYMPSLEDTIIFIEEDYLAGEFFPNSFDRDLQSLIHQSNFEGVKGIIIGRAQKSVNMTTEKLKHIIKTKKELSQIPIISDVDFGHTTPQITLPIGGKISMKALDGKTSIKLLRF